MARRGRPPKPVPLKLVDGNPGKRPLPGREPKPPPSRPRCPAWLPPAAKAAWRRIVPELDRLGLLTTLDREKLANLCVAIGQWEEVTQTIAATGYMIRGRDGNAVRNPLLLEQRGLARLIHTFGADFGLSPVDRVRLAVGRVDGADDLEDILGGLR